MSPLPNASVLPDDWSQHHRDAAEGFLTGTCKADRPVASGDIEWGQEEQEATSDSIWRSLPCSAQILTQANRASVVVESVEIIASHRISVPLSAIHLVYKDYITILSNPDDPVINGRSFTVLVEEKGTTNWTRDYLCQEVNSA